MLCYVNIAHWNSAFLMLCQIFTLSAVPKEMMPRAIEECFAVLKPGGLLLFRDYGNCWIIITIKSFFYLSQMPFQKRETNRLNSKFRFIWHDYASVWARETYRVQGICAVWWNSFLFLLSRHGKETIYRCWIHWGKPSSSCSLLWLKWTANCCVKFVNILSLCFAGWAWKLLCESSKPEKG